MSDRGDNPSHKIKRGVGPTPTEIQTRICMDTHKHSGGRLGNHRTQADDKPGTKEIKQKNWVQGGDQNKAINAEVEKLTSTGILREAIFPTRIVNPVMVKSMMVVGLYVLIIRI